MGNRNGRRRRRWQGHDFRVTSKANGGVQEGLITDMKGKLVDDKKVPWMSIQDIVKRFIVTAEIPAYIEDAIRLEAGDLDLENGPPLKELSPRGFYFKFKSPAEKFCGQFCQRQIQHFIKLARFPYGLHHQLVPTGDQPDKLGEEGWGVSKLSVQGRFPSITGWGDILYFNPNDLGAKVVCKDGYQFPTGNNIYLLMEGCQLPTQVKFIAVVLCALAYDLSLREFYHDEFGISVS